MTVENDRRIFASRYPAIVPFLMEEYRGEISFEIYSGIRKTVEVFEKAYEGRYFSKKALTFIAASLDAYIEKHGYLRDKKGVALYYNSYEMRDAACVNTALILPETVLLTEALASGLKNPTTFSLPELLQKKLVSFVTVLDGEVASIATVNETLEETKMLEVTVETAVKHRGKGYAQSSVAALCAYLLEKGCALAYCCRNTHTKSNRIARAVGFEKVGRFYAVSAYRVNQ